MTPERWKRVEELYYMARARPLGEQAAFLAEACVGDEELRVEVESLLTEPAPADGFLSRPPIGIPAAMAFDAVHTAMTGQWIGGYHLQTLLGAGGMGEVYLSHDRTLGRDVAIKVLPRAFTNDADRVARLEREARVLAALNHPNICAIYSIEEADAIRFLVLELVDGETLAEKLADLSGGLSLREVVNIARQIAEALEAAHEKGIIHRDLKPANIKITPGGVVKVLDFGLAKAIRGNGSKPDLINVSVVTQNGQSEGILMGTAAYMSPEQARGLSLDNRTDIWAFGCVLYEMLTGRVTFTGDTVSDTIAKILEREPDWSALPPATPAHIRRLLLRCFAKDPKQRLRDVGDARIEIDAMQGAVAEIAEITLAPARTYKKWLPWVAVVAIAAGFVAWELGRSPLALENPLTNATFSRLTNWDGTEGDAEISPDGRFVVFLADRAGQFDVWRTQVGTGDFVNLTADVASLAAPGNLIRNLGFSGDGAEIWFSPAEARAQKPSGSEPPKTEAKLLVPLIGGTLRAFLGERSESPSWSPDGTRLAYFINRTGDPVFVADRTGADGRQISGDQQEGMHNHNPVWSADSQWIYFVHGRDPTRELDIRRVRPTGGSSEVLTQQNGVRLLAPIDERTLLYVARADDESGPWLWALDVTSKVKQRVTVGLEQYTSVAASADGRRLVATVANPTANLSQVALLDDRIAEEQDVQLYPLPTVRALAPRFSNTSLFYLSNRRTGNGLWRWQDGKASEVSRGEGMAWSEPVAVSRDGNRVAVVVRREGQRHLAIMAADGTNSKTLAPSINIQGAAGQGAADWSPDGTWIAAGGSDASGSALFKIPVDGGPAVRLTALGQAVNPVWSPDGDLIVYSGPLVAGESMLLGVRPNGVPVELGHVRTRQGAYRFLPDGSGLVFLPVSGSAAFWLLDLATKKTRPLTRLSDKGKLQTFDITPDGKQIVFDRSRENSHVVVIDLPR
jgi:Tol biopolymer transport system component